MRRDISDEDWNAMEDGIARSPGFCMTMGTASTMTALAEALGMTLPGASSIPAVDSNHVRMAMECGRRIVEMVGTTSSRPTSLTLKRSRMRSPSIWRSAVRRTRSFIWSRWRADAASN